MTPTVTLTGCGSFLAQREYFHSSSSDDESSPSNSSEEGPKDFEYELIEYHSEQCAVINKVNFDTDIDHLYIPNIIDEILLFQKKR